MIGIQVGAVSFVDEGVDKVLDIFQQSASINTLFVATFTYGRGIAGRQVPGQPLPDHGKQEYDTGFRGVQSKSLVSGGLNGKVEVSRQRGAEFKITIPALREDSRKGRG